MDSLDSQQNTQFNSQLHGKLQANFGFNEFRPGQAQTINQLLNGHSSLAIFPTGSGKSLCYQFTALQLPNLTLVVSPLLALMKDQVEFLKQKNIAAASLDSSLSQDEYRQVMQDVRNGSIKILMISVERFKNERFRQFIQTVPISMLVVDEAHCISEWGHNFRPDYLKLPSYRKDLNIPLTLLLTATATKAVKRDMAEKFDIQPEHIVQTGFYRPNLDLSVLPVKQAEKLPTLVNQIRQQHGSGIVYVTLQHSAETVASYLQQCGISATAYHAGFDSEKRQAIQNDFMQDKVQVIVATIAFGMGIDKSNIRFVIHYDLPKSIENYSQEIGRAGRDGQPSNCITLANLDGLNTVENFVYGDTPERSNIQTLIQHILDAANGSQWEMQTLALSKLCDIRALPLKTLLVQLEILGAIEPAYSYYAEYRFKLLEEQANILQRFDERRQQVLKSIFNQTKFNRTWAVPDLHACFQSEQLERAKVLAALEYLHDQQLIQLESKQMTEVYHINTQALQDDALVTTLFNYFKDKEQKEIKRIAALVRFFELDQCLSQMLARYFDHQDVPQQCGHCSVCRGQIAKLEYSEPVQRPTDSDINNAVSELKQYLNEQGLNDTSVDTVCRFLAGMTTPLFTQHKVKQLDGFGLCEQLRYRDLKETISRLDHL
ncbi:RecQ family ATP-dependent DNA helicase [Bermanella marisrubri]|uniref:ATP-dependent DNA helicase RecQ n=1 Tax=Bermanella marisrubri TaxID=207949 RepID=Q1N3I0_9GAMM|nr:RecQ family ATP-dependent DNA helicase [Bermanella marisrubri]EAT12894.1 RecQ domain protein [Oceanobacter sp. RED65] [Bermanella marisrubri]QIZ83212.1 RecQ family ATP-dependent DNA helicase [Bermanella marisrubri]